MWNEPNYQDLEKLPTLNSTDEISLEEKLVHMHFFLGSSDWYAAEYDPTDRIFFGYVVLNGDYQNAEWGYFSLDELKEVRVPPGFEIDRDLHWTPREFREIESVPESKYSE